MRSSIRIFLVIACAYSVSFAQPCDLPQLLKQPGHWIPGNPNPASGIAAADLAKQRTIINNMVQPIQKKYLPKGIDIEFNTSHMEESRLPKKIPLEITIRQILLLQNTIVLTKRKTSSKS